MISAASLPTARRCSPPAAATATPACGASGPPTPTEPPDVFSSTRTRFHPRCIFRDSRIFRSRATHSPHLLLRLNAASPLRSFSRSVFPVAPPSARRSDLSSPAIFLGHSSAAPPPQCPLSTVSRRPFPRAPDRASARLPPSAPYPVCACARDASAAVPSTSFPLSSSLRWPVAPPRLLITADLVRSAL